VNDDTPLTLQLAQLGQHVDVEYKAVCTPPSECVRRDFQTVNMWEDAVQQSRIASSIGESQGYAHGLASWLAIVAGSADH
jgi:hypothetical protein